MVFFLPFVIGWIVAAIANPLVRFFEKTAEDRPQARLDGSDRRCAGSGDLWHLCAVFLGVPGNDGVWAGTARNYASIREEVESGLRADRGTFEVSSCRYGDDDRFPELEYVGGYIGDFVQKIAASAGSRVVRTLPEVFVNTIIVFLSSYLFLADHDKLVETVGKVMPEPVIKYGRMMKSDIRTLIGGYFLAQFKIMFVVAVVLVIGMLFLRVPYGIFLGIAIAILDFLPMFGTGTALIPWAVVETLYRGVRLCAQPYRSLCFNTGHPSGDPAEDRR